MAQSNNNNNFRERALFIPKLRRNKKLEEKLGEKYFIALKQTVFSSFEDPFIPAEPPKSLQDKNEKSPSFYRCKQCNDCFRFKNTYEEHVKRRSWILGYWCNTCYVPKCNHAPVNQGPCKACVHVEEKKRWYLRFGGLRKGQKRGTIKIFYNQCSFFEHLEQHDIRVVEPTDVMLMPFPNVIEKDDFEKLDKICYPLFERMFLLKVHVVDWLKDREIYNNWWQITDKNSPINALIKEYKPEQYFDDILENLLKDQENGKNISVEKNRVSPVFIDLDSGEEEEEERSDDPCPPVDIAFVDCGPIPKAFYPKNPPESTSEPAKTSQTSSFTPKISVKKFANDLNWSSLPKSVDKPVPSLIQNSQKTITVTPNLVSLNSTSNSFLQSHNLKPDTKILTVRGPKGVNLSTLIKQLPHDVINNKKIVFIGQQTDKPAGLNIQANSNVTTYKSILPVINDSSKPKFIKILPNPTPPTTYLQSIECLTSKPPVDSKVNGIGESSLFIYKNGKKYLMKRNVKKVSTSEILSSSIKVGKSKNIAKVNDIVSTVPSTVTTIITSSSLKSIQNGKAELTPEETVIKCIETDFTGEQLKITEDANKNAILKTVPRQKNPSIQATVFRYRQQMLMKLPQLPSCEITNRIEHFRNLIKKGKTIINNKSENMSVGHNSMINILLKAYEKSRRNNVPNENIVDPEYDSFLEKWEIGLHYVIQRRCKNCNKTCKPETYIFGLSKETKNPAHYCTCNEFICYMCNLYQGSSARFQAHMEYHKKQESFVCPECFNSHKSYKELAVHVWTSCFHTLTRRLLGCNVCQIGGFENMEALARHFSLMHATKKVSCSYCVRIFNTHSECREHQKKDHIGHNNLRIIKIIVCDVGDCIVNPKLFRSHMNGHMGTQKLLYYKCPVCYAFIKDTGRGKEVIRLHLYVYHIKKLQDIIEKDVLEEIVGSGIAETVRKENLALAHGNKRKSEAEEMTYPKIVDACTITPEIFENVEEHSNTNTDSDVFCNRSSISLEKSNDVDSGKTTSQITKNLNSSNLKSSSRKKAKRKPGRIALNGPSTENADSQDYRCHLCGELINTSWSVVRDHFGTKHSDAYQLSILTPTLLRISNEFIEKGYQEYISKKRKSDGNVSPHKRRKRWTPKKHTENAEKLSGMCVMPETSQNNDGHFVCKKCDKRCENADDLRKHIALSHRIRGMYLICLECGENFIVAPSLQMHLKAFHGIDDPISYLDQNPLHAAEVMDDLEEKMKTVVANQCHVCMAVFEDKTAVDKHFRVHGMAFLNRKRIEARNAVTSSDKDIPEEEREEVITLEEEVKEENMNK